MHQPHQLQLRTANRKPPTALGFRCGLSSTFISYHDKSDQSPHGVHSFKFGLQSDACRCATMVTATKKLHFLRCSWTAASLVKQHKPSSSPNVKTAFLLKSWRESHLVRPASLTLSTLAGKACCDLSNLLRPFARLR